MPDAQQALEIFDKQYHEFKQKAQEKRGALEDWNDELEARESSNAMFEAIVKTMRSTSILGQSLLAGLWKAYINKLHIFQNEAETLMDAVIFAAAGKDIDIEYAKAMVRVVSSGIFVDGAEQDSIFMYVHRRETAKDPVTDPEGGKKLTLVQPDDDEFINLISSPNLISKLKESTYHFSQLPNDKKRDELLIEIATGTRAAVKALRNEQKQEVAMATILYTERDIDKDTVEIEFKTTKFQIKRRDYKKFIKKLDGVLKLE